MISNVSSMVELRSRGGMDCPNPTQHGLAFIQPSIDALARLRLWRLNSSVHRDRVKDEAMKWLCIMSGVLAMAAPVIFAGSSRAASDTGWADYCW
jgi:hypothetical protein